MYKVMAVFFPLGFDPIVLLWCSCSFLASDTEVSYFIYPPEDRHLSHNDVLFSLPGFYKFNLLLMASFCLPFCVFSFFTTSVAEIDPNKRSC